MTRSARPRPAGADGRESTDRPVVLLVGHTAREGGAELALLRVVSELGNDDVDLRAVMFEDGPMVSRFRQAGVRTVVVPLAARANTMTRDRVLSGALWSQLTGLTSHVLRLSRAIRGAHPDLVVANTLKAAIFVSLAAPLAGRRWVWHLHDRLAADYLPAVAAAALRALAAVGPHSIVTNSLATLRTLPRRAAKRAVVAYPGVGPEAFLPITPTDSDARTSAVTVGIIGRISPTKGQREFIDAAALVARTHPDAVFRVVGAALFEEGAYESSLREHAQGVGVQDRVVFTGWVADPGAELRGLDVLVHASPVPEPFGQVVVEAMAGGVPVVAADAGGVREILDGAVSVRRDRSEADIRITPSGVLFRPGDPEALAKAMALVLDDRAAAMTRAARARADASVRFPIARTADVVFGTWQSAIR